MIAPVRYTKQLKDGILARKKSETNFAETAVREIIANVREKGDDAVRAYTLKFDGYAPENFEVTAEEMAEARKEVSKELTEAMRRAAQNIREFHAKQLRQGFEIKKDGVLLGQKVLPVDRAGIYVPGGTAAYPSTVLMNAIPAKIAGVKEVVMVTPPKAGGKIKAEVLVAAEIAGVDRIFKMGGAQAIAALAYGTESVPKVDKITGPGNVFVATAKKEVFGDVGIDMIAGPSEILIIADDGANAKWVAADMLSQAEHDKLASAVLVTDSERLAEAVDKALEERTALLPRKEIAETSLKNNGKIIIVDTLEEAAEVSNELAPEHLELAVRSPLQLLEKIRHAGSVFLGDTTPEPLGDYYAGTNHTLPTSGTAKFSSPLGVEDFMKTVQYIYYDAAALARVSDDVTSFAESEGLSAHAQSVSVRGQK